MATRHAILLLTGLLCASHVLGFSLTQPEFDTLIKPRCFNRSATTGQELMLGQNEPVGMSIENLISLIERMERLNPSLKPDQVLRLMLKRFHIDGVKYNGHENVQSNLEYNHAELTKAILSGFSDQLPSFPENQFTEDEKCNLFFTLSHVVNVTALSHEEESNVYWSMPGLHNLAKAPAVNGRDMGKDVVLPSSTTPKAVQSSFLEEDSAPKAKKVQKRAVDTYQKNIRLTKRPREYGVASFMGSKTNPISVNRVLLGMLVGFSKLNNQKMSDILRNMGKILGPGMQDKDKEVETLFAVTLSDLFGIDTGEGMTNQNNKQIFGADGEWNSTVCHTQFVLNTEGILATLAEFRGGLDGYNIGNYLHTQLLKEYPDITASQVLRFYYSRNGLSPKDGICYRSNNINSYIKDDLKNEATSYLMMWNSVIYNNQHGYEKITGYINEVETLFSEAMEKASVLNNEENAMCKGDFSSDIRSKPLESNVDALFVLDITQKCTQDTKCKQAEYVSSLVRSLKLGRNLGSVSVLFNARGVESPNLVDDEMNAVSTALYSVLYNSTSNECASCRAANYDSSAREVINDRVELLNQLNLTLGNFEEKRSNESGVPAKAVFWFDYGTVRPIPSDKIQKVKYDQIKRTLLYIQRDFTFFGLSTNATSLKDIVVQEGNLVSIDPNTVAIEDKVAALSQRVMEVPSVFQYGDCKARTSNNITYQGFITPGFKQYWALYPDTFRSSSTIQLRFSAENSPVEVCYGRVPKPEGVSENCKRAGKANEEVSWVVYNPCKGMIFEKCPPLYFTITVNKAVIPHCNDPRCQNIDQTKWYFSHTGISCSRASAVSISLFLIAFTTILSHAFNKNVF